MKVHIYAGDGIPVDHRGEDRCTRCEMRRANQVHDVPERDEEERRVGARITGEREEQQ